MTYFRRRQSDDKSGTRFLRLYANEQYEFHHILNDQFIENRKYRSRLFSTKNLLR